MLPEPFLSWLHTLFALLRENDEKALFLSLLLEEAGVPLPMPGDVIIMFAGYRVYTGEMDLMEAVLAVVLAVLMGSTILYSLSRRLGHLLLFKYGRFIQLDEVKLNKVERWIQRRGPVMVLVGRLTPGLRTPTSIISGMFNIPFHQFVFYTSLAAISWGAFWLLLGYFFGGQLLPLARQLHSPLYLMLGLILLLVAGLALHGLRRRRKRQLEAHRLEEIASTAGPENSP